MNDFVGVSEAKDHPSPDGDDGNGSRPVEALKLQVASLQAKVIRYQGFLEEAHASIAEMQVSQGRTMQASLRRCR